MLAPLVISIALACGSLLRSYTLRKADSLEESVLCWNLLPDRFSLGLFLNAFFVGSAFLSSIIVLPQQFQVVYNDSASTSGYLLLCLTLTSPVFSDVAGFLMQKRHIPPLYILLAGQSLVVVGCGLASSIANGIRSYSKEEYGYQVIMGAGFGRCLSTVVMAAPLAFIKRDMVEFLRSAVLLNDTVPNINLAVGMGTTNQMRNPGGSIGISICANILSKTLSNNVADLLSPAQFQLLLGSAQSIHLIPRGLQDKVRDTFAISFQQQMYGITGLCAAGLLCALI